MTSLKLGSHCSDNNIFVKGSYIEAQLPFRLKCKNNSKRKFGVVARLRINALNPNFSGSHHVSLKNCNVVAQAFSSVNQDASASMRGYATGP